MKKKIATFGFVGFVALLLTTIAWTKDESTKKALPVAASTVKPAIKLAAKPAAEICPDANDFGYWVDVFDDGGNGVMNYRLNVCKLGTFTYCDVTVRFKVDGIDALGNPVTVYVNIWIPKNWNCNQARIGYTWREVTDISIVSVTCTNCTYPPNLQ